MPRELIATGPGKTGFRKYEEKPLEGDQIRIRTEFAAPKHGTESHGFAVDSAYSTHFFDPEYRMYRPREEKVRVFPKGLGNMAIGEVIETGPSAKRFKVGDRVYGHLPIRETQTVSESRGKDGNKHMGSGIREAMIEIMPEGMSNIEAVLLDPAHFALAAVRDANVRIGEWVAVYGLGAIGLMIVQMARQSGAERIFAVDPLENRRVLAKNLGAEQTFDPLSCDAAYEIKKATDKHGVDVAIEVSANYAALQDAIRTVHYSGLVVTVSNYKGVATPLKLDQEWHLTRVTVKSSMPVWGNPSRDYPLWDGSRYEDTALRYMMDKKLITDGLIDPILPFEKAAEGYMLIVDHPEQCVKLGFEF